MRAAGCRTPRCGCRGRRRCGWCCLRREVALSVALLLHHQGCDQQFMGELTAQVGISEFSKKRGLQNLVDENERVCGQVSYET